jgi:hypothetical protein
VDQVTPNVPIQSEKRRELKESSKYQVFWLRILKLRAALCALQLQARGALASPSAGH